MLKNNQFLLVPFHNPLSPPPFGVKIKFLGHGQNILTVFPTTGRILKILNLSTGFKYMVGST